MNRNEEYESKKNVLINAYYNESISIMEIAKKYDCKYQTLKDYYYKVWNCSNRPRIAKPPVRYNAKYSVDFSYFNIIDSEHKAYWLGMFVADGFVNNNEISLCLQNDDIKIIEQFKFDLKSEHPIKFNKDNNPFLTIVCKQICNDLINKGFHNRKSYILDIEYISSFVPDKLIHHFIRGMFDGDGCIKYYKYDYLKKPQYHFGYTGLKNVCEFVRKHINISRPLIQETEITYTLITRNPKEILKIFDFLYKDATIYMERKYNTFKEIETMTFNDYNKAIS